jgi:anaerobic magnesium-protoporphyrin IX monomethyl ester cyclase
MLNQDHTNKGPVVLVSRSISYTFPLSYAYLAGYLIEKGESVIVLFREKNLVALAKQIIALNPLLVGFGNLYPELPEIRSLINMLNKEGRSFPIVIGGQMVSPTPEFAVKITGADIGVIGEGEIILYQLVRALRIGADISNIKGLVIRKETGFHLTGQGEFIEDLSLLPKIPYELFPTSEWLRIGLWYSKYFPVPHWRYNDLVVNIHGGRGCPFNCNFCYHHSKPRYRPMNLIMKEAELAVDRFNANMLYFSDDLVISTPKRARELIYGLSNLSRPVEFSISTRIDILNRIDDDLLLELKKSGCRIMGLGIESGSDRILKLMGKNCTAEQILYNLRRLKKVGILPTGNIMIGNYDETIADVEDTIKMMLESVRDNPNLSYTFSITTPYPGSQLYDYIMKNGLLSGAEEFYDKYFSKGNTGWNMVYNLSQMSDDLVYSMFKKINYLYKKEKSNNLTFPHKVIINAKRVLGYALRLEDKIISFVPNSGVIGRLKKAYLKNVLIGEFIAYNLEVYELKYRDIKSLKH